MNTGLTTSGFISQKIDKKAIESVKSAIFQRAITKASGTDEAIKNSSNEYNTSSMRASFQNDLMKEARNTIGEGFNPFSANARQVQSSQQHISTNGSAQVQNQPSTTNYGGIAGQSAAAQNDIFASAIRESAMSDAHEQVTSNHSLSAVLQFLNTQNAISAYNSTRFS